jgi:predicted ester cyclase
MGIVEENKQVVRREFEAFDATDSDAMDELFTADFVAHDMPPGYTGDVDGWKQLASDLKNAFPDTNTEINELIGEDDKIVVRFTSTGTHQGEVFGLAPTGRAITITGIEIFRLSGGKVAEYWAEVDLSELFGLPGGTCWAAWGYLTLSCLTPSYSRRCRRARHSYRSYGQGCSRRRTLTRESSRQIDRCLQFAEGVRRHPVSATGGGPANPLSAKRPRYPPRLPWTAPPGKAAV